MLAFAFSGFVREALLWLFAAGFALGGAAAILTVIPSRRPNPARFRAVRPVKIFLLLSVSVACGTAALFARLPEELGPAQLPALAVGFVAGSLGLSFKKAAGIPLAALAVLALLCTGAIFSGWQAADRPGGEISLCILSLEEGEITFSVSFAGSEEIIRMEGGSLSLRTEFLRLSGPFAPLARFGFFRHTLLAGEGEKPIPPASGPPVWEKLFLLLPGAAIETVETEFPALRLFSVYTISRQGDDIFIRESP